MIYHVNDPHCTVGIIYNLYVAAKAFIFLNNVETC